MSEKGTTATGTKSADDAFWEWLKSTPAALAQMVKVAREYAAFKMPAPSGSNGTAPGQWAAHQPVVLTTVPLSENELDALSRGMAEAVVVEKAIEWLKGVVTGIALAA